MRSIRHLLCSGLLLLSYAGVSQITRPIGINLSYVADYSTELVFTDAFKQGREWISSNADNTGPWDTQVNIPLGPSGYPLEIPFRNGVNPPQKVKTLLVWDLFEATPKGKYRLIVKGSGEVQLNFGARGTFTCPVDTLVEVTGAVSIEINRSDKNNPINDIKFILPGYVNNFSTQTFTRELLTFLKDFQVIRFMDFTHTNGSPITTWAERTPPNYYTQSKFGGAAWEYVVQLANGTLKDIWINIPHKANDAYIRELATLLRNTLNPGSKIYLEYSNELWNGAFSQNADCAAMAQEIGISGQPWERTWKFTAKRSADVFRIFGEVFGGSQRLVRTIPSQAANSWLTEELITYFNDPALNPTRVKADAVAIAPYFGNEVADDLVAKGLVNTVTVPQILQELKKSMADSKSWMDENKRVADKYQMKLISYEGGQHLVATGNNIQIEALTKKLIDTNRDTAMQTLYCSYMEDWYKTGGDLFCHFSSVQGYSEYGSWGIMEQQKDSLNPKYVAFKKCIFPFNQTTTNTRFLPSEQSQILLYPNPTGGEVFFKSSQAVHRYQVFNGLGQLLLSGQGPSLDLSPLPDGLFWIKTEQQVFRVVKNGRRGG
ncbi:MAG: T9SS type A sorting domain-containing protein [Saprospiraceae bacterium]